VVRVGPYYVVYIATADLLKLAERDEAVRRAMALYLAEKAKDGTPRQRELAEKILKRHPLFLPIASPPPSRSRHRYALANRIGMTSLADTWCGTGDSRHVDPTSLQSDRADDGRKSSVDAPAGI